MKTKLFALLPILSAVFSIAGCGGSTDGVTVVKMSLMNSMNENDGWFAQIDMANQLMEADGVNVRIEKDIVRTSSWDEFFRKISTNMAGRVGGTIGRIAESHMPLLTSNNRLQDLTDIADDLKATGLYSESAFGGVSNVDGKTYGLPTGTQHMVLYYNKDAFDNAKLPYPSGDWTNPSTFEEIKSYAKALTTDGVGKKFGFSAGPFLAYAGMYAVNSGGENIFNDQGQPVINTQPFYDVYQWFADMLITDKSMPNTQDTQTSSAIDRFLTGNIAMIVDGIWQLADIIKYTEFNVGIAAIPVKSSEYDSYTTTFRDCFFAARTSKHPEADKTALRYLMKAESITALASESVGGFPVYNGATETYTASLEDSKLSDYVDVIVAGKDRGLNVPYSSYYNLVDQVINQYMVEWIDGSWTTKEYVDFMQEKMIEGMNGDLG